jgi:hypothetical protein
VRWNLSVVLICISFIAQQFFDWRSMKAFQHPNLLLDSLSMNQVACRDEEPDVPRPVGPTTLLCHCFSSSRPPGWQSVDERIQVPTAVICGLAHLGPSIVKRYRVW